MSFRPVWTVPLSRCLGSLVSVPVSVPVPVLPPRGTVSQSERILKSSVTDRSVCLSVPLNRTSGHQEDIVDIDKQSWDYFLVIDFEATCDNRVFGTVSIENQEIIEFPWVMVDARTGEVVEKKQLYVRPVDVPLLTEFCKNLTGIQQEQVDAGILLQDALLEFTSFCQNLQRRSKKFIIVTDGEWDLKCILQYESSRKKIFLPDFMRQFINLKKAYAAHSGSSKLYSLKEIVSNMGLTLHGRHHSGIDDCMTIALCLQSMLKTGFVFDSVTKFEQNYDPVLAKDFKFFNQPFPPPDDFVSELTVGLSNVSPRCKESDLFSFLHPVAPRKFLIVAKARKAFVELASDADLFLTVAKNGNYMVKNPLPIGVEMKIKRR